MSIEIRKKEKLLQKEQWDYLSTHPSKRLPSFCFDDDDDEDYTSAITPDEPVLSIEELDNSLSMGDEHLDTILATKSNEFIKSSVETLIPIPRGIKASNDNPIPFHDPIIPRTPPNLTPSEESDFFLEVLCDAECESDSSDDQSSSDEDILKKIVSKPLFEEEIIPMKSLRTYDSSLLISSKIDSLLEEFAGELALLKSIPPGIDETDCDFEEDIRLIEKLL
nr:hypothetical protein [Tanacetum cinerariifolium]GFA00338.1 hypothetical protein [Tanacetum cinerariifolium]